MKKAVVGFCEAVLEKGRVQCMAGTMMSPAFFANEQSQKVTRTAAMPA